MQDYQRYIESIICEETPIDALKFKSFFGDNQLSAIVKASMKMVSDLESRGCRKIAIGFPNLEFAEYEFILGWALNAILNDDNSSQYSIDKFKKGQNIKLKNVVCRYLGIENRFSKLSNKTDSYVVLQFCDGEKRFIPINQTPIFQDTDAKKLSSSKSFDKAKKDIEKELDIITSIRTRRTHLKKTVFFSSIENKNETIKKLGETTINGFKIKNLVLLGQLNGNGDYSSMLSNTDIGTPALVVSSDLYGINNYLQETDAQTLHSVVFRANKSIKVQYDPFKEIGYADCSKIALFDSFDRETSEFLSEQEYVLFNWNTKTIISTLTAGNNPIAKQLHNYVDKKCEYRKFNTFDEVGEIISKLNDIKDSYFKEYELPDFHYLLFSIALRLTRNIVSEPSRIEVTLSEVIKDLEDDKYYLPEGAYEAYFHVIDIFSRLSHERIIYPKKNWLYYRLNEIEEESICIVVSDNQTKAEVFEEYCSVKFKLGVNRKLQIDVVTATDFINSNRERDLVFVVGWLSRDLMRKIICSCLIKKIEILLYAYEFEYWKQPSEKQWNRQDKRSSNSNALCILLDIQQSPEEHVLNEEDDTIAFIEKKIHLVKYSSFLKRNSGVNDIVDAYPVEFDNGCVCFFREHHRVSVITKIINGISSRIEIKTPDLLEAGDYILIVESDRDVVKDLADSLIAKSDLPDARVISNKWKVLVADYLKNRTVHDVIAELREIGCSKNEVTIRNWIQHNEDMISPGVNDFRLLLDVVCKVQTEKEKELIISASRLIRTAHQEAGKVLAQLLRKRFNEVFSEAKEDIRGNCFELIVEGFGKAHILQVSAPPEGKVQIDSSSLNKITEI